jgi:hypothetical protein
VLLATYGAPAPRGNNPLVIILGVCGGCVLLLAIAVAVMVYAGYNMSKGLIGGAMKMPQTSLAFTKAIESHNYSRAAALVDPAYRSELPASKIQAIIEKEEHKLGPIQASGFTPSAPLTNQIAGPNGRPQFIEYSYQIPLRFKNGSATGVLKFRSVPMGAVPDISKMKLSGDVTGFSIQTSTSE